MYKKEIKCKELSKKHSAVCASLSQSFPRFSGFWDLSDYKL